MSMMNRPSLSPTYVAVEDPPVPEPEPIPEPKKQRGRPPGSRNKPKEASVKRSIPWYRISWSLIWWATAVISVLSLYHGVLGWLGQSAAYITLSVSTVIAVILLNLVGKKLRE